MSFFRTFFVLATVVVLAASHGCRKTENAPATNQSKKQESAEQAPIEQTKTNDKQSIRVATFNTSMNRKKEGDLLAELQSGDSLQISRVAGVIRRVRPDILLLNEFDFDPTGKSINFFQENFLAVESLNEKLDGVEAGQGGSKSIRYPYVYTNEVNTGVPSGVDLNNNEKTDDPNDAFGFGQFPGQYGMVVLSMYPIQKKDIRTFQKFHWKDMPDAQIPVDPETGKPYYGDEAMEIFRLSSKSHWDVPIDIDGETLHFLVCHPTPPVFDGKEDRNGKRNHDEIRMWSDYIDSSRSEYFVDDRGQRGGLAEGEMFVIAGDMNADPNDGDSSMHAIRQLTEHPLIENSIAPKSVGGVEQAKKQGKKNAEHKTDPATDTGDFRDDSTGNMRIDYVLPSKNLTVTRAEVFWPASDDPAFNLTRASDHRMVWIDIERP